MPAPDEGIVCLPIPTPFLVGRVNCYLIDDDPLTLVDTGPNSGKALDELERALAAHGHRAEELKRIVITHQHMDHLGLVGILARRSGAEVCAIDVLAPWMGAYGECMEDDDRFAETLMARHGVPEQVRVALRAVSHIVRAWGAGATVDHVLHDGETLDFAGRALRVHHRPGHSPSDTVLHDEQRGLLLGGDHLIGHISSNPLVARPLGSPADTERGQSLVTYMESLRATQAMELEVILPGHGKPVTGHRALIDERVAMHERRAEKIFGLIAQSPRSAFALAQDLWGNVAITQAYLTLSEILGHTDLLANAGRVRENVGDDGVALFVAV